MLIAFTSRLYDKKEKVAEIFTWCGLSVYWSLSFQHPCPIILSLAPSSTTTFYGMLLLLKRATDESLPLVRDSR